MIFCEHCFKDKELISIICSTTTGKIGTCPICKTPNSHLYDTTKDKFLTPYFEEFLNTYSPVALLPPHFPEAELSTLVDEMRNRWHIFSDLPKTNIHDILVAICPELYASVPELFRGTVGIPELYEPTYLEEHSLFKNNTWDSFCDEIKNQNRYHPRTMNLEILEKYCSFIRKTYRAGTKFYRARISDGEGYPIDQMSAPPKGKSADGRANAKGITCMYVANDIETTLYEVRAGAFDYVCVGEFQLKKDIVVVDLKILNEISPFIEDLNCLDHAINTQHLERLNMEMGKPLRRSDSTLDYVPTQYIVDFIKSIMHDGKPEYAGIEYNSTLNPGGYNLALFDPDVLEGMSIKVYEIKSLRYTWK